LIVQNLGQASGIAFVQVLALPGLVLWMIYALFWNAKGSWSVLPFPVVLVTFLLGFAWRARRIFLAGLRHAAASRYSFGDDQKLASVEK
jgi:hypothetical protein